jgi:hypothetical protein
MVDTVQVLGGVLIVLSMVLLCCWATKQTRYEGMKTYADDLPSRFEGMSSRNIPGLNFNSNVSQSMHDLEGLSVNRHIPNERHNNVDIVGLKWKTEGMSTVNTTNICDLECNELPVHNSNQTLGGDILTPIKEMVKSKSNTHSGDQFTMTDHAMGYGIEGTSWAEARNNSVITF